MPIYSYKCEICDESKDIYRSIDERNNDIECDCGQSMKKVLLSANIRPILGGGDWPGYMCPVTDTFVTSRRERRNIMAEHNLVEAGGNKPSKKRQEQTDLNRQ